MIARSRICCVNKTSACRYTASSSSPMSRNIASFKASRILRLITCHGICGQKSPRMGWVVIHSQALRKIGGNRAEGRC